MKSRSTVPTLKECQLKFGKSQVNERFPAVHYIPSHSDTESYEGAQPDKMEAGGGYTQGRLPQRCLSLILMEKFIYSSNQ